MIFLGALGAGLINSNILQEETEGGKGHLGDPVPAGQVFFHELDVCNIYDIILCLLSSPGRT